MSGEDAVSLRNDSAQLDQFVGVGVHARRVHQSGGEAVSAVAHGVCKQAFHLCQFIVSRGPIFEPDDVRSEIASYLEATKDVRRDLGAFERTCRRFRAIGTDVAQRSDAETMRVLRFEHEATPHCSEARFVRYAEGRLLSDCIDLLLKTACDRGFADAARLLCEMPLQKTTVRTLIKALSDKDGLVRYNAYTSLKKITSEDFSCEWYGDPRKMRTKAVGQWERWWRSDGIKKF